MHNVIKPYFVNQVSVSGSSVFLHSSPFIFLQEKCDPPGSSPNAFKTCKNFSHLSQDCGSRWIIKEELQAPMNFCSLDNKVSIA